MELWDNANLIKALKENKVVVMPTDALYGIVGRAQDVEVVQKIYNLRKRSPDKPCIILIGDIGELKRFSVSLTAKQQAALKDYWSFNMNETGKGPVSIIFECLDESFIEVGPLIAPSANIEGMPPSQNIMEAKKYFGDLVDLYIDAGVTTGKASKIIQLNADGSSLVVRE
ncbi:Sua5/YciO/YrdC/YwlC family protein [Candidatus Nomurabacteria bacterium]|nr:Sua5/YciO/YrdC/YwlC family protein [Candidatus Nomurabacteria bacterium]